MYHPLIVARKDNSYTHNIIFTSSLAKILLKIKGPQKIRFAVL